MWEVFFPPSNCHEQRNIMHLLPCEKHQLCCVPKVSHLKREEGIIFVICGHSLNIKLRWWLRHWSVCLKCGRLGFDPWVGKIPWRRKWQPTPVFLPGKSHGWRILVGYSSWGRKELDLTEWLHFHFFTFS